MRLIHTADWHLGRLFHGVHLTEDQAFVLDQLVELVADAQPDALIVAGDIYDRAVPPPEAVALLDDVLSRIVLGLGVPTVVIAGNHDSPDRLAFASRLLAGQGLHLFGALDEQLHRVELHDRHGPLQLYAVPYVEPAIVRQHLGRSSIQDHDTAMRALLEPLHPMSLRRWRSLLVGHLVISGGRTSDSERPLSLRSAGAVDGRLLQDFCYVALGHLHSPQSVGRPQIRYAGSLLKYSFAEADEQKSVDLIEIDHLGHARVESIPLRPRREVRCLSGRLAQLLTRDEPLPRRQDYLKVTLLDEGPVLDAMGRLREIYPNTLQIERPALTANTAEQSADHRRLGEAELFAAFFAQVTDGPLSAEQQEALAQVLTEMHQHEREAQAPPQGVD